MSESAQQIYSTTVTDTDVRLTPAADAKMAELTASADVELAGIRLFVTGGGCSGMAYGMTYAEVVSEYDSTLEGEGYKMVIDAVALNYLAGCEIDYSQGSFKFKNVFQTVGGSGMCGGCGGGGF